MTEPGGAPLAGAHLASKTHGPLPLRDVHADLCRLDLLELAYAEVSRQWSADSGQWGVPQDVQGFLRQLSGDLQARTFQPTRSSVPVSKQSEARQASSLRDQVVQAAFKLVLERIFATDDNVVARSRDPADVLARSPDRATEKAVKWVTDALQRGLTRVYIETVEPLPQPLHDERALAEVRRRIDDPEAVRLLQNVLAAGPDPAHRGLLAPVLADIVFHGIDAFLQQAQAIGRRETLSHVDSARFGNELVILVDADPHFDWVMAAVQRRLGDELSNHNFVADPLKTQLVNLGNGETLRFMGFELRCVPSAGGTTRVHCERIDKGGQKVSRREPESAQEARRPRLGSSLAALPQRFLAIFKRRQRPQKRVTPVARDRDPEPVEERPRPEVRRPQPRSGRRFGGMGALAALWHGFWSMIGNGVRGAAALIPSLTPAPGPNLGSRPIAAQVPSEPGFFSWRRQRNRWAYGIAAGLAAACLAAVLLWPAPAPEEFLRLEEFKRSSGAAVRYAVHVPAGRDPAKPYPMIVFLHQYGRQGTDGRRQCSDGISVAMRYFLRENVPFDFIVLFPQSRSGYFNGRSDDSRMVMELVDHAVKRFRVDPDRIYLTGVWSGGTGVWNLAAENPERWAAIVPLTSMPSPALVPRVKDIPCWCFHGEEGGIEVPRAMMKALEDAGGTPRFTELPGLKDIIWNEVYMNKELYQWLGEQRRQKAGQP